MKYWFKLLDSANSNCILKQVYNSMLADMTKTTSTQKQSWINKVKDLLDKNGFTEVWYNPHSIHKETFLAILKRRLTDNFIVELRAGLNHSTSMSLFRNILKNFRSIFIFT